ncbi:hypothetical protein [uncultured Flavobacterium sp.]|uniref:hypothetical protein n=1 Tax=uncultured Flavobacterium sp. TaxID=165435 RepID=UPI00263187E7|nr:hypothetical protein [uncultured Flavobacterium sp.]
MKNFILLIITFISIPIIGQDLKTIKTSDYEISYPSNFRYDDSKTRDTEFIIYTEKEDEKDTFIENINLLTQNLKGYKIDLNQYVIITENQIKENGKLIESKRTRVNNSELHSLSYTANLTGRNLKFYQYLIIQNEKAYILTYSAEIDKFDVFFPEIIKIFNSFSIK